MMFQDDYVLGGLIGVNVSAKLMQLLEKNKGFGMLKAVAEALVVGTAQSALL